MKSQPAPLATLYLRHEGVIYRFRVYESDAQLEAADEIPTVAHDVAREAFDPTTGVWDNATLQRLIDQHTGQRSEAQTA